MKMKEPVRIPRDLFARLMAAIETPNDLTPDDVSALLEEADHYYPHEIDSDESIQERLEELRVELRAERISYSELAELQDLAEHIDRSDVELLEAAGVPEFPDDDDA